MLCTLISLICTLIIIIGGTNKNSAPISGVYFFRIDTRYISTPSSVGVIPGVNIDNDLLKTGFNMSSKELGLADFYTSSLWNYCSGTITGDNWEITACEKASATYFFDPIQILNVSASANAPEIEWPTSIQKINNAVQAVSKAMITMYVFGFISTVVTFAVGWFGLLSRWGSCVTTIFANISFFCLLSGSIMSTALYYSMQETYNKALSDFSVAASTNRHTFSTTWLAVAFSLAASIFWLFSTCCCSGKKARVMGTDHGAKGGAVKTGAGGHNYERIAAPYQGGSGAGYPVPMTEKPAAFEPYRHG
jgi:hypothetical protein